MAAILTGLHDQFFNDIDARSLFDCAWYTWSMQIGHDAHRSARKDHVEHAVLLERVPPSTEEADGNGTETNQRYTHSQDVK